MRRSLGHAAWGLAVVSAGGGIAGLIWAGTEIARQRYLAHGLWRTAVWTGARDALMGVFAGAAVTLILLSLAALWSALAGVGVRRAESGETGNTHRLAGGRARLSRRTMSIGLLSAATVLGLVVVLVIVGVLSARRARAVGREGRVNVILIGLDTVRADRMSLASADERERDLTPSLRGVAKRGLLFPYAISQAPWTLPAFASMLTGLYPAEHGADEHTKVLAPAQLTLAEILREEGYRTMGISSGLFVTRASGLHQGFEVFDESLAGGQKMVSSVGVTDRAIRLLEENGDRPFFLFAHYFDPHWVYHDHGEYEFAAGYDSWVVSPSQDLTQEAFEKMVRTERPRPGRKWLDPEEIEYLTDLYDEEIAFTDREVGRLLRYIRDCGLEQNTLVIVVGDHGEEFLERGYVGHGKTLYQEVLAVPLVMTGPSITGGSVCPWKVETRALFTTILDSLGLPPPSGDGFPRPLLPPEDIGGELVRSATYTKAMGVGGERFARPQRLWVTCLQDGRWKLMKEHLRGNAVLYDLEEDPGETRDASKEHSTERARLARVLDELDSRVTEGAPRATAPRADEEHQRKLKALGYL